MAAFNLALGLAGFSSKSSSQFQSREERRSTSLNDRVGLLQRGLDQELIDRGPGQLGRAAQGFIDLVGHAGADAVLLDVDVSHAGRVRMAPKWRQPLARHRRGAVSVGCPTEPQKQKADKVTPCRPLIYLVEPAGIEPASASPPPSVLHA